LLRPPRPKKKLGRPRADDRTALEAIVFALKSGIPWEMPPRKQLGLSGMTVWRRLEEWTRAGVWKAFHHELFPLVDSVPAVRMPSGQRRLQPRKPEFLPSHLKGGRNWATEHQGGASP